MKLVALFSGIVDTRGRFKSGNVEFVIVFTSELPSSSSSSIASIASIAFATSSQTLSVLY